MANKEYQKDYMGTMVVKAKAEVNAYAELRLQNLGVKCLMNDTSTEIKNPLLRNNKE